MVFSPDHFMGDLVFRQCCMRVCRSLRPAVSCASLSRRVALAALSVALVLLVLLGVTPLWHRHALVLSDTSLKKPDELEVAWAKIHKAQELAARAHRDLSLLANAAGAELKSPVQDVQPTNHPTFALSSFQCTAPISPISTCVYLDLLMWGGEVRACTLQFLLLSWFCSLLPVILFYCCPSLCCLLSLFYAFE
jgi:hypothetical protein